MLLERISRLPPVFRLPSPPPSLPALVAPHPSLPVAARLPHIRLLQESHVHLPEGYAPANVLVVPWVPQTAVLGHPAVKGFLCHGGHTTSNEALATGTPMLCMPFVGDQLVVAQHIKDHGYGLQVRWLTTFVRAQSQPATQGT